ncbi:hypothetical protein NIES21_14640 [Anabaenopsis circularis NIES-21]|uniref:Uncharacterized protein n=1 Tax=Anabaenopsis circularis NIES-21 TaxID=1085406 RepID=A0A1Z4GE79_9CYAN|nr:hypothetical protein NIES21_14640 [Anabaenopsis circularis NIES-21]
MANCPNCGSKHIQLVRETNVNWGRAVAGWALFGVVGGAVGAVTGEDRNANICLDCGTSWKASDLYKTLQIIKEFADITLDLTIEEDRFFLNRFISEINPYIEAIPQSKLKAEKLIKDAEIKKDVGSSLGICIGLLISIVGCSAVGGSGGVLPITFFIFPIVGGWIGTLVDKSNKKRTEQEIENVRRKAALIKIRAEEELQQKLDELINEYKY